MSSTSYPSQGITFTPISNDRQASARLQVELPADAKLYVDGQLTTRLE